MVTTIIRIIQLAVLLSGLFVSIPFMIKTRRMVPQGEISTSELNPEERKFI